MRLRVNFNKAPLLGDDFCYAENAIKSGKTFGDGPITREVESFLLKQFNFASGILLTSSCTHALEIIALLLNLKKDDEIIVPSFTFCSSASAFMLSGAKIVFADCEVPSMNINPLRIETLISNKTKAIVVVHYGGLGCNMEKIMEITRRNKLILIEDNAHGFFGEINGKKLGSFGDFSTLSFHGTKNFSCGEGGALVVNNSKFLDQARIIREKGTNRFDFKAGKINKYEWVDMGSSYLMSEISAGILKKQLENFEKIQNIRKTIWFKYQNALMKWGIENDVKLPSIPNKFVHAYHAFHLIFPSSNLAKLFMEYMKSLKIEAISHYQPLHNSPIIRKVQNIPENIDTCPNSTTYSERLVRLPLYFGLEIRSVEYVIEAVLGFTVENIKI